MAITFLFLIIGMTKALADEESVNCAEPGRKESVEVS
jgi:hypothetical protein